MPSRAKNISDMDLAEMIKERESKMQAIKVLERDLSEARADLNAINSAIAKELGITGVGGAGTSGSVNDGGSRRPRTPSSEMNAAQAEVLDIIKSADGPVRRGDVALRLSRDLKPVQLTSILSKLVESGSVQKTGERAETRYAAK